MIHFIFVLLVTAIVTMALIFAEIAVLAAGVADTVFWGFMALSVFTVATGLGSK